MAVVCVKLLALLLSLGAGFSKSVLLSHPFKNFSIPQEENCEVLTCASHSEKQPHCKVRTTRVREETIFFPDFLLGEINTHLQVLKLGQQARLPLHTGSPRGTEHRAQSHSLSEGQMCKTDVCQANCSLYTVSVLLSKDEAQPGGSSDVQKKRFVPTPPKRGNFLLKEFLFHRLYWVWNP